MKKILGLDMGAASIGWAVVEENEDAIKILELGTRIVPYEGTEGRDFAKGAGESRNSIRTKARTTRKGYDRYQLRRRYLLDTLLKNDMMPDEKLFKLPKMELWALRDKAVEKEITKEELGRLFLWLNQKRGYKSGRIDANLEKKDTEYVADVKERHEKIKEQVQTIGQYFYGKLCADEYYRVKENIFPREAYIEEFDAICERQKQNLNLSDEFIQKIRDEIIYYQRPLKSQKGLVSVCELEGFTRKGSNGKEYFVGPKVAHKSSPLFQIAKIWENINNIKISSKKGENLNLTIEQKQVLFDYLDNNEKLSSTELFKILGLKKNEYVVNKQLERGLQGNITKLAIVKCLENENYNKFLKLDFKIVEKEEFGYYCDKKTGEILGKKIRKYIDPLIEKAPFYQLWHTIYSISDTRECCNALQQKFNFDETTAIRLSNIDFRRLGFGNKSVKAMRKILPYLMEGDGYSVAKSYAGLDNSSSMTEEENLKRKLLDKLRPIEKNSLRQPIVERIINQMVNVVNSLIYKYSEKNEKGEVIVPFRFDEIRIELARELKQSREERNKADKSISKRQRENEDIEKRLKEYGLRATRRNRVKWRLFEEVDNKEKKMNAICIYCGQTISLTDAIKGVEVDVEHIIPKAKLFDDSQSNKTLAHRKCNSTKGDMTAYDFMKAKPDELFNAYVERVNSLYINKIIGKAKRDKLLMTESKIPSDFIDRQLRESQYIAKKAREILQTICYNVWSTSGTVTAELRHLWGWDDVTMNLQMSKYKELEQTEVVEWESEHGKRKHTKEIISGWQKRDDHRHHAVDALTIACTKQGYIHRFNTLNSSKTHEDMEREVEKCSRKFREKRSLLEKYIISKQPITVSEVEKAVSKILISFKAGKKVAVKGSRKIGKRGNKKIVQTNIIVPRGALSEDSIYGKIKTIEKQKSLKYIFENSDLIIKTYIKNLVEERLRQYNNDTKKSLNSLKKEPIYLDKDQTIRLEYASCYGEEYVVKYTIDVNFNKLDKVVDRNIKDILKRRLDKFNNKAKEAFKDVQKGDETIKWYEDEGLKYPIRSVRCFTGLSAVVPVKKNEDGEDIGFVKPGNNHHISIYKDSEGNYREHVCTFWHAVERKKYNLPVIIENTNDIWDKILLKQEGTYPDSFLEKLPPVNYVLELSMQQNEMLVLEMQKEDFEDALKQKNYSSISKHLYVVWSLSNGDYWLRHHLETKNSELKSIEKAKEAKRYYRCKSLGALFSLNPIKVRINHIGEIVSVGEY